MKEMAPPNAARKEAPGEITVPGNDRRDDFLLRCFNADAPILFVTET